MIGALLCDRVLAESSVYTILGIATNVSGGIVCSGDICDINNPDGSTKVMLTMGSIMQYLHQEFFQEIKASYFNNNGNHFTGTLNGSSKTIPTTYFYAKLENKYESGYQQLLDLFNDFVERLPVGEGWINDPTRHTTLENIPNYDNTYSDIEVPAHGFRRMKFTLENYGVKVQFRKYAKCLPKSYNQKGC